MEVKETSLKTLEIQSVLENTEYYKYIFKKTEKIVCAIFFITHSGQSIRQNDRTVSDLEVAAKTLLDTALVSLKGTETTLPAYAHNLMYTYIALESSLRIAHASQLIGSEHLEVFLHEIDSVERLLKKYTEHKMQDVFEERVEVRTPVRERKVSVASALPVQEGVASAHTGSARSRRDRVLDVVRDKGEATIKDIVTLVTDCSEKTIQRELISLIKDNVIKREGERRWSKYSLL